MCQLSKLTAGLVINAALYYIIPNQPFIYVEGNINSKHLQASSVCRGKLVGKLIDPSGLPVKAGVNMNLSEILLSLKRG